MQAQPVAAGRLEVRVYLIRHGRTLRTGPDSHRWPLSPEGEAEARHLASAPFWTEVSAMYSSTEEKALSTVRPAAEEHGLEIRLDERLSEVRRPPVWIAGYEAAVRRFLERPDDPPEGWEPSTTARARVIACLREIAGRHPDEGVAVCGHGLALTLYLGMLEGKSGDDAFDLWGSIGFGEVAVVERERLIAPFGDRLEVWTR